MFGFHKRYFLGFLILLVVEVLIALFLKDKFIRPYLGDVLVVMLLYCFIRSFLDLKPITAAAGVLIFAFLIEMLQYFNVVGILGLEENRIARTVLGSSFDWIDVLAYCVGAALILIFERKRLSENQYIDRRLSKK